MAHSSRSDVAVIVVHGVADQLRGETAAAVAAQLASAPQDSVLREDGPIATPPLWPAGAPGGLPGHTFVQRVWKSARQSVRSDFLDTSALPSGGSAETARGAEARRREPDEGVLFTDYLLAKARSATDSIGPRVYDVPRFEVRGPTVGADVYEMYWADLSRLSGFVTRIVTELFTLLFHLSKIGVDTVALASRLNRRNRALRLVAISQRAADWMFSRLMALLSLQLLLCVVFALPRAALQGHAGVATATAALLGLVFASLLVYRGLSWRAAFVLALLPGLAFALFIHLQGDEAAWMATLFTVGWIVMIAVAYDAFLVFAEERFKAVLGVGRVLFLLTVGCVVYGAHLHGWSWDAWATGCLNAIEVILLFFVELWIPLVLAGVISTVAGTFATWRRNPVTAGRIRGSLVTGHLGLFASLAAFLAGGMTFWALISSQLGVLVDALPYDPLWFRDICTTATPCPVQASTFLRDRFISSTEGFALLALALLSLVGYLVLLTLPSLVVEARIERDLLSKRLGGWLTKGYRALDRFVCWWSAVVIALAAVAVFAIVDVELVRYHVYAADSMPWHWALSAFIAFEAPSSTSVLKVLVYVVTGGAVGLVALGGLAFKWIRAVRAPLDVALDVDNYFREFPRKSIPRVEIAERYVALLNHVLDKGYRKLVIVAHSQGTVITADLLRYVQQHDLLRHPGAARLESAGGDRIADAVSDLHRKLSGVELKLLTVGCPLRQMYAMRFPFLYRWVLESGHGNLGPDPAELGVRAWSNVWGSGDYVGRWLWAPASATRPSAMDTWTEEYAYAELRSDDAMSVRDQCMGADAHTHYFDLDQALVASEISRLVGGVHSDAA